MKVAACLSAGAFLLVANFFIADVAIDISPVSSMAGDRHIEANRGSTAQFSGTEDFATYILERPLFSPERRDFVTDVATENVPASAPVETVAEPARYLQIKLLGTRVILSKQAALLQYSAEEAKWYPVGESVEGWTVQEISRQGVTLVSGGTRQVVEFSPDGTNGQ